jgi:3-phenylpropionate/trans-cinnamate dioxygenase ferredoxin component
MDDLAAGMRRRVAVPGSRRTVLVLIEDDGVFAIENACPHHGSTFDGGAVTPTHLVCPWHFWRVDFRTGSCLHNPFVKAATYPTSILDGVLHVDVAVELAESNG